MGKPPIRGRIQFPHGIREEIDSDVIRSWESKVTAGVQCTTRDVAEETVTFDSECRVKVEGDNRVEIRVRAVQSIIGQATYSMTMAFCGLKT